LLDFSLPYVLVTTYVLACPVSRPAPRGHRDGHGVRKQGPSASAQPGNRMNHKISRNAGRSHDVVDNKGQASLSHDVTENKGYIGNSRSGLLKTKGLWRIARSEMPRTFRVFAVILSDASFPLKQECQPFDGKNHRTRRLSCGGARPLRAGS